jgi:transcriptional regulator with XRE-family HTH domain
MDETVGERLQRFRVSASLTHTELADASSVTEKVIRELEAETRAPTRLSLEDGLRIALALNVDPYDLTFGKKPPKGYRPK